MTAACGGSQSGEMTQEPESDTRGGEVAFVASPAPVVPTAPVIPPAPVVPQTFQSLEELQDISRDLDIALRGGAFDGALMTAGDAPTGRAFYEGVMILERVTNTGQTLGAGGVAGQLNLAIDFGSPVGGNVSGLARSFVYLPQGSTILGNPDGARSVLGSLSISGDVETAFASPGAPVLASLETIGSVQIPQNADDFDPAFVTVKGTYETGLTEEAVGFVGIAPPLAGDTYIGVTGLGTR